MTFSDLLRYPLVRLGLAERWPTVSVLRLDGVIGQVGGRRRGLSIQDQAERIERAFAGKPKAVALVINSPGGAAAQSALLHDRIRALAHERQVPVLAFCEDVAASGGYMLALAADEIHAHAMSIIGSIGVVSAGFGFTEAIARLGVERRVYTAGENKCSLDPFLPEKPEDVARIKDLQRDIHQGFKDMVSDRRRNRLKAEPETLFTGDVWTGRQALALGLIDGLGDVRGILRARFGDKVHLRPIRRSRSYLPWHLDLGAAIQERVFGADIGAGLADGVIAATEERALWARFGL